MKSGSEGWPNSGTRRGRSAHAAGGFPARPRASATDLKRAGTVSITLLLAIASTSFVAGLSLNAFYKDALARHEATISARTGRQILLADVMPPVHIGSPARPAHADAAAATPASASRGAPAPPPATTQLAAPPPAGPPSVSPVARPARPAEARREPVRAASAAARREIVVSLERKQLWLLDGADTVLSSPIAVASNDTFSYGGKVYRFQTPRGHLRILSKIDDPKWIPPDWHYYEKAVDRGLEVVKLAENDSVPLSDGSAIVVHNGNVGRINRRGQYWDWTPGMEIMIDGKIFIPPANSPQRRVPDALGPYKLGLGNGIYIHGTNSYDSTSIGTAASHGCIRMPNALLRQLYDSVGVGTPVVVR